MSTDSDDDAMTEPVPLARDQIETLREVVGHIIPASRAHGAPGADDDAIFADIVRTTRHEEAAIHAAISEIHGLAGGPLGACRESEKVEILARFRAYRPDLARALEAVTAWCYYRDDRVMRSIGMEVRPPFPGGFTVDAGDWSLVEPVLKRGPIYRDAG